MIGRVEEAAAIMSNNSTVDRRSPSSSIDGSPCSSPSVKSKMMPFQNSGGYTPLGFAPINVDKEDHVAVSTNSSLCPAFLNCRTQKRIVNRDNGRPNIERYGIARNSLGFITDSFTTIINSRWYVIILFFAISYILSWLFFGGLWILVANHQNNGNHTCVHGVDDFTGALLLSVETQVTIGFGNNYIEDDCPWGLIVVMIQCLVGLMLDGILLGLLFTKITRPRSRRKTILFSEKAVIFEEEGKRYLEFRVGNLRTSQIAEAHIRLVLYWYRQVDGEYEFRQHDLNCGYDTGIDRVMLLTPVIVRHEIDENSPLWDIPSNILSEEDLELVVVLEGIVEATSLTVQALWSYTAEEIVLGEKLRSIVSRVNGQWIVDFRRFDEIITKTT